MRPLSARTSLTSSLLRTQLRMWSDTALRAKDASLAAASRGLPCFDISLLEKVSAQMQELTFSTYAVLQRFWASGRCVTSL